MSWKFWHKNKAENNKPKKKKSKSREWVDAILFAVIAATIIRVFFIEAYTIPTGSMERSLLIGDFLFVSKVNYGPRIPMTPVAFPFAHHTMPITGTKAYWEGIQWDYRRIPGLSDIKRNDVVVFNYPREIQLPLSGRKWITTRW
jgi:signal peptidase I